MTVTVRRNIKICLVGDSFGCREKQDRLADARNWTVTIRSKKKEKEEKKRLVKKKIRTVQSCTLLDFRKVQPFAVLMLQ